MKTLAENKFGHGALPKKWDARDHKTSNLGRASVPFDWNTSFSVTTPFVVENQGQSFSCGGQALRYYLEALKFTKVGSFDRLSARDSYCHIFYPGGGTTVHDIGNYAAQAGVKQEVTVASYFPGGTEPTEQFMEDRGDSNASPDAPKFREFGYAFAGTDIESVAEAVRDNDGCILQVDGQNNGTWLSAFPQAPTTKEWSHFLFAGKAGMINGKKYISVLNSWGVTVGENGWQHLGEDYFQGHVTNAMVLYDTTLYQHQPTTTQTALTWLQRFLIWIGLYTLPYTTRS